jgi:hypothetical protein
VRYWFAGEANVCVTERRGQTDVSSAYGVPKVGIDAHGSPVRALVRKTSWYDAVQAVIKAAGGTPVRCTRAKERQEAGQNRGRTNQSYYTWPSLSSQVLACSHSTNRRRS